MASEKKAKPTNRIVWNDDFPGVHSTVYIGESEVMLPDGTILECNTTQDAEVVSKVLNLLVKAQRY
jgi:hypothetical protein